MPIVKRNTKKIKVDAFTKKKVEGTSFQKKVEKANELLSRAVLIKKQSATSH